MTKQKTITELRVPPELAPFWEAHGARAAKAITEFLKDCKTPGDRLGALGVLANVLVSTGGSIQAMALDQTKGTKQ